MKLAMTDLLYHRGPDGYGFHFDEGIGFGHRRLSIIDIDGAQFEIPRSNLEVVETD